MAKKKFVTTADVRAMKAAEAAKKDAKKVPDKKGK